MYVTICEYILYTLEAYDILFKLEDRNKTFLFRRYIIV